MGKDIHLNDEAKEIVGDVISAVAKATAASGASVASIRAAALEALKPHLVMRPLLRLAIMTAVAFAAKLIAKRAA